MIHRNPDWKLVRIFADKGITGTSVKNRDEFNRMIRLCKLGKVDMIITKSISRFARNTEDCLHYTRLLKEYGVDVYFEEQKIHSTQPGAEFYITIYGSIAQSESENISANVRWGKEQSAKQGKVPFQYKNFLGYKKGTGGKPEIVEEAVFHVYNSTNRNIFEHYLWNVCQYVVLTYINTVFSDYQVVESDKNVIVKFYKCEIFGQIIWWLDSGMQDDLLESSQRLCELRKGMTEELFRRSSDNQ